MLQIQSNKEFFSRTITPLLYPIKEFSLEITKIAKAVDAMLKEEPFLLHCLQKYNKYLRISLVNLCIQQRLQS